MPWRTFRWRDGQRHNSDKYWTAANRDRLIYGSRLELARLLPADQDIAVGQMIAQLFLLDWTRTLVGALGCRYEGVLERT